MGGFGFFGRISLLFFYSPHSSSFSFFYFILSNKLENLFPPQGFRMGFLTSFLAKHTFSGLASSLFSLCFLTSILLPVLFFSFFPMDFACSGVFFSF